MPFEFSEPALLPDDNVTKMNENEELMKDTEDALPTRGSSEPDKTPVEARIKVDKAIPKEKIIPELIPVETHNAISEAMKGRLESDIPLDDDYWRIKNVLMGRAKCLFWHQT